MGKMEKKKKWKERSLLYMAKMPGWGWFWNSPVLFGLFLSDSHAVPGGLVHVVVGLYPHLVRERADSVERAPTLAPEAVKCTLLSLRCRRQAEVEHMTVWPGLRWRNGQVLHRKKIIQISNASHVSGIGKSTMFCSSSYSALTTKVKIKTMPCVWSIFSNCPSQVLKSYKK